MKFSAKKIAALAVMAAILSIGKFVLNLIPNVEVVTLFCALFGYSFGLVAMLPITVFCLIEMAQWGVHVWVLTYLIHFNLVSIVFWLLSKKNLSKPYIVAPVALVLTLAFGFLDAFLITALSGFKDIFYRFTTYYINGIGFVLTQVISNVIIFAVAFFPLSRLFLRIKEKINI